MILSPWPPSRRDFLRSVGVGVAAAMTPWTRQARAATSASRTPEQVAGDEFWLANRADYETRRRAWLEFCAAAAPGGRTGVWSQLARIELHRPIDERPFREAFDFIRSNHDCNDFTAAGLLRILHHPRCNVAVPAPLREEMAACLLDFKYWWDEPGRDERAYHTENHQIIFHSDQLLAGQMFADRVFTNSGRTGQEQAAVALARVQRWLDWRVRFGFSEWLSNCYFEHDIMALANLRDFAAAPSIRARAEMLIDVLLFEIALHSHRGVMGCSHGRTYTRMLTTARGENTSPISKLIFGTGVFNEPDNMGALALATSSYRCPAPIIGVAADLGRTILARERHSLNVESAAEFGLSCEREEDVTLFWSVQDYVNPLILDASERISLTRRVRNFAADPARRENYAHWRDEYRRQIAEHGRIIAPWQDQHAMGEVHLHTLRGLHGMLSCAQDYRPGMPGYQQHIWQATLGPEAIVFTNHPGSSGEGGRPDFWAGNGTLPRAVQHRDVLCCLHRIPRNAALPFSHAFFPRAAFEEVVPRGSWTFARHGTGKVALYSQHAATWQEGTVASAFELRSNSPENVWICAMDAAGRHPTLTDFIAATESHPVRCEGLRTSWISPAGEAITLGWDEPLKVAGREMPLHHCPRFDSPYCQAPFLADQITIRQGGRHLELDFATNTRLAEAPAL